MTTEPDPAQMKAKLTARLRGQWSGFSKNLKSFQSYVDQAKTMKTEMTVRMMNESWLRCTDSLRKAEATLEELVVVDESKPDMEQREKVYQGHLDNLRKCEKEATTVTQQVQPPAQTPQQQSGVTTRPEQPGCPKSNDLLRPDQLQLTDVPSALREWKRVFTAYYKQHKMQLMSQEEQQLYFSQCLSRKLYTRIQGQIQPETPVLKQEHGPDEEEPMSCYKILDNEFRKLYPLVKRRRDAFEYKQSNNQGWSDMSAKLKDLIVEGELQDLEYDQLVAYLHIMATTDPHLRTKFFQMEEPTLEKMAAKASSYESAETSMKGLGNAQVQAVQQKTNTYKKPAKSNTKCSRCTYTGHEPDQCRHKNSTCHGCNEVGHIKPACPKGKKIKDEPEDNKGAEINTVSALFENLSDS